MSFSISELASALIRRSIGARDVLLRGRFFPRERTRAEGEAVLTVCGDGCFMRLVGREGGGLLVGIFCAAPVSVKIVSESCGKIPGRAARWPRILINLSELNLLDWSSEFNSAARGPVKLVYS